MDVLLGAVLDELRLEKTGMAFDLVSGRGHTSAVDEGLEVLLCVVGDTNGTSLGLVELGHCPPCVDDGDVVEDLDVAVRLVGLFLQREQVLVDIAALVEGNGEVDEVQVEVVEAELSQAVVESFCDVLGAMLRVPQLGYDEEILALDTELGEGLLERSSDLLLVAVDLCQINVLVAGLEGLVDSSLDLSRLGLPRAETQLAVMWQLAVGVDRQQMT